MRPAIFAVLLACSACGDGKLQGRAEPQPEAAIADAQAAFARGDRRFVVVLLGVGNQIPGVDWSKAAAAGLIEIDVGDFSDDRDHDAFRRKAQAYALRYNTEVLRLGEAVAH